MATNLDVAYADALSVYLLRQWRLTTVVTNVHRFSFADVAEAEEMFNRAKNDLITVGRERDRAVRGKDAVG